MLTSEVLNRAADLIEERGWGQGEATWSDLAGAGLCLEGGIYAAMGLTFSGAGYEDIKSCPAYRAVWAHLEGDDRWGMFHHSLYNWNDMPDRTAAEVIEVLRAAAAIEQARESEPSVVSA